MAPIQIITLIESLYLLFMYMVFQTKYSVGQAYLEKEVRHKNFTCMII
jgi:hypothetical protein